MTRRLLNLLTALSLLLCVAVCGVWVRSYWRLDTLEWGGRAAPPPAAPEWRVWWLQSGRGSAAVALTVTRRVPQPVPMTYMEGVPVSIISLVAPDPPDHAWQASSLEGGRPPPWHAGPAAAGPLGFAPVSTALPPQAAAGGGSLASTRWVLVFPHWAPCAAMAALAWATVYAPRRRRNRRRRAGLCVHCGYDLTGNESGVCPECGRESWR